MSSTIWMVRAGSGGYCIDDFLKGYIGVGWNELGDLSDAVTRDAIRARYNATYPDDSKSKASNAIAMNHKFRSVLAMGTWVLTYDTENRVYHLGKITSDYMFKDGVVQGCSHIREVV